MGYLLSNTDTLATMRNLFREYAGEFNSTVIPDVVTIDQYLNAALEEMNRRLRYHKTTATLTLTAGTQEYALPTDCICVDWIEHVGREIAKRDIEAWRREETPWRLESQGFPREWAHYANKLTIRPTPSAAAVTAGSTVTLRYVSTPLDISSFGPVQLATQDHRVAVYHAVALWSGAHPDTGLAIQRHKLLMDSFEREVQLVQADYAERELAR